VVFDTDARLPLESALVGSIEAAPLYVVTGAEAPAERVSALREAGADVLDVAGDPARRVVDALAELGRRQIGSVLLEGGAELAGSFAAANEVDELRLFIAPLVLRGGRPLAAGPGAERVTDAVRPLAVDWERSGEDMLVRARLREW